MDKNNENEMVTIISGAEFRDMGLLWWINQQLHLFGLAIILDIATDELKAAKVRFRGFDSITNDNGYKKISEYLKNNIETIIKDCD